MPAAPSPSPQAATRTSKPARRSSTTALIYPDRGGKKQVHDIIEAIKSTLHDQPLTLVDHDLVDLRHEFSEARPDPDGDTYHGIVRYRAVTEPAHAVAA